MNPGLEQFLTGLYLIATHYAVRVPTPQSPAPEAWERKADEYCHRAAWSRGVEQPSPEVASALLPRLHMARTFGAEMEPIFERDAPLGDTSGNECAILEWLLVTLWHKTWRAEWLSGGFQ